MRRWQILVVDDQPDGSLEAALRSLVYVRRVAVMDDQPLRVEEEVLAELLEDHLPERYTEVGEEDLTQRNRREICEQKGRRPIVDVERTLSGAWRLLDGVKRYPPDIVFLDVKLDEGREPDEEIARIHAEVFDATKNFDPEVAAAIDLQEFKRRGGLYLFGKLSRELRSTPNPPLIVIFSNSVDIRAQYHPIESAFPGRFEVAPKTRLNLYSHVVSGLFQRCIESFLIEGRVNRQKVGEVVASFRELLEAEYLFLRDGGEEPEGDVGPLLRTPVGDGWLFGTLFVEQVAPLLNYCLAAEKSLDAGDSSPKLDALEELERLLRKVDRPRQLRFLVEDSPWRLLSHSNPHRYDREPVWWPADVPFEPREWGRREFGLHPELADRVRETLGAMSEDLRKSLEVSLEALATEPVQGIAHPTVATVATRLKAIERGGLAKLDGMLQELSSDRQSWARAVETGANVFEVLQILRSLIRAKGPLEFLPQAIENTLLRSTLPNELPLIREHGSSDFAPIAYGFFLPVTTSTVGNPLRDLLDAIVYGGVEAGAEKVTWRAKASCLDQTFSLEVTSHGPSFERLESFPFVSHKGDLSSAIRRFMGWGGIEIASGDVGRNPFLQSSAESASWRVREVVAGCTFRIDFAAQVEGA